MFLFWVFIGIIGGNPEKRISEGLFRRFFFFIWDFYRHYRGGPLINVFLRVYFEVFFGFFFLLFEVFIGIIGGDL